MPNKPIVTPAVFLNQRLPCWTDRFSRYFLTKAIELPAITIGNECPSPNSTISKMPVVVCCWIVMMARMGAMNPNVQDPERTP